MKTRLRDGLDSFSSNQRAPGQVQFLVIQKKLAVKAAQSVKQFFLDEIKAAHSKDGFVFFIGTRRQQASENIKAGCAPAISDTLLGAAIVWVFGERKNFCRGAFCMIDQLLQAIRFKPDVRIDKEQVFTTRDCRTPVASDAITVIAAGSHKSCM